MVQHKIMGSLSPSIKNNLHCTCRPTCMYMHSKYFMCSTNIIHIYVYSTFLQAAGYTLSELLPLCRSSILQQRVLALNTLARITQRGMQGEYAGVIEGSVVGRLLEAEVPLLLRYALDDSNDAVFCVAVHALHSLLVLMPEEVGRILY